MVPEPVRARTKARLHQRADARRRHLRPGLARRPDACRLEFFAFLLYTESSAETGVVDKRCESRDFKGIYRRRMLKRHLRVYTQETDNFNILLSDGARAVKRQRKETVNRGIYLMIGVMIMLIAGTVYTWSIISRPIAASFPEWSAQTLSMTFTITMMGYASGGMVSGILLKKTGPKAILAAGAALFAGGMALSSFAQTPALLYIGFGAMCGLATGLCYNSTVSTVSAWFPDRQGVASGTLLAGFGMSSFIAGKLFAAFAPADGSRAWAAGLRVLALLALAVLIAGVLVMRAPAPGEAAAAAGGGEDGPFPEKDGGALLKKKGGAAAEKSAGTLPKKKGSAFPEKKVGREPASDIPAGEMIRKPVFWLFYIWIALLTASGLMLVSQASGIAAEVGTDLSANTIATAVGMISILNAAGRICTGTVFDRFGYRITMVMVMAAFGFSAVMMILAVRTGLFALVVVGFAAGGFAYGGNASISPPMILDFYGRTWYATNFALIPTNALFTSFASVLAGRMYDRTHSYLGSLYMLLGAIVLSVLISFMIRRPGEGVKNRP